MTALTEDLGASLRDTQPVAETPVVSGHTPGPWVACGSKRGGCSCGQVWSTAVDMPVATANGIWGDDLAHPYGEIPAAHKLANSRLIAAAPDLLAALKPFAEAAAARDGMGEWEITTTVVGYLRAAAAAYAKATTVAEAVSVGMSEGADQ